MALTIHQAGIDAAINAQADGFAGVTLNRVELYNGSTRVATLPLDGVQVIEPGRIYVVAQDSSTATYDVQRIDFYTSTGVKFATAQNDDGSVIQSKAANTTLLLAHQLNLASASGSVAPSGDVSVYAPQATESLLGTAEIATQGETDAGSDDTRFVTPKKLGQWLRNKLSSSVDSTSTTTPASVKGVKTAYDAGVRQATESLRGQMEIANDAETKGGTDKTRAVVPYYLKQWWESVRTWGNIKDKPVFKTAAFRDAGKNDGEVALIGDPSQNGKSAVVVNQGSNGNGGYKIYSNGYAELFITKGTTETGLGSYDVSHPITLRRVISNNISITGTSSPGNVGVYSCNSGLGYSTIYFANKLRDYSLIHLTVRGYV